MTELLLGTKKGLIALQGDPGAGERDHVEPVAADVRAGPGGQVAVGHLRRRQAGWPAARPSARSRAARNRLQRA